MTLGPDRPGDASATPVRVRTIGHDLRAVVRLSRPPFLLGGVVLNSLGVALAVAAGAKLDVRTFLGAQLVISATQLMVHFGNDYFDLAADRANVTPTAWSGGSRVLPAGELRPAVALGAAVAAAVAALASTVVLAVTIQPAPAVLALVLLAILVAWEYSAPPLRLHSRGLGEVVGALLVAGGTPLVGYGLQMHRLDWLPLLAVLPLCALQFGMLVVVSLPDVAGDAVVGKRTLAVRCGRPAAGRLAAGALALAYVSLLPLVALGLPAAAAWGYGVWLPVAGWHGRRLWHLGPRSDGPWDALGFWSILLVMGSALTVAIAVAILPRVS